MVKLNLGNDINMSRNRLVTPMENFFVGNLVHHLFPRLPAWNLAIAHQILMKDPEYYAIHLKQKHGLEGVIYELLTV